MTDDAAKPPAPAPFSDPFASAKASLRDTIKWLATTFGAVTGVVIAGTSLSGISKLTGSNLDVALGGGVIGLLCIVTATGVMLRLLMPQSFYFGELVEPENRDLMKRLNKHAIEILPPEIADIETFVFRRNAAVQQIRDSSGTNSASYKSARSYLDDIQETLVSLTYLAHYEKLRDNLRRAEPTLFALALGAICGLGIFAVFTGKAKDPPAPSTHPVATNISFDASRSPFWVPPAAAEQKRSPSEVLTDALNAAANTGTASPPKSTVTLQPILGLVQSLASAGVLPKEVAESIRNELIKNAVEGGREIVVDVAKKILERFFPPETSPGLPPISVNVSGCCPNCPHPPAKVKPHTVKTPSCHYSSVTSDP